MFLQNSFIFSKVKQEKDGDMVTLPFSPFSFSLFPKGVMSLYGTYTKAHDISRD